jgi:hypothetical protein
MMPLLAISVVFITVFIDRWWISFVPAVVCFVTALAFIYDAKNGVDYLPVVLWSWLTAHQCLTALDSRKRRVELNDLIASLRFDWAKGNYLLTNKYKKVENGT